MEVYQVLSYDNIYFNVGNRNLREINWDFDDDKQWNKLFDSVEEREIYG